MGDCDHRCDRNIAGETAEQKWRRIYGTEHYGQLPQYKKDQHEGHCWRPCPYSTQSTELQTKQLLGLNPDNPLPPALTRTDHTDGNGKVHYMKTHYRGKWGFECTFDDCDYYQTYGEKYFYS